MQQCQKCGYEFTLREIQEKSECPKCAQWAAIEVRAEEIKQEKRAQLAGRSAAINKALEGFEGAQPVVVVDINMKFWSMVVFMVKWAFAAIPAVIIILVIAFGLNSIFVFAGKAFDTSHYESDSMQPKTSSGGYSVDPPKPAATTQVVSAALIGKGFEEGKYNQDKITISILFKNDGSKDIRAFDGALEFTDLLGNMILTSSVRVNEALVAGNSLSWDGSIDYNEFMPSHKNLRYETQDNIRLVFKLGKVLYSDGSKESF